MTRRDDGTRVGTGAWSREARRVRELARRRGLSLDEEELALRDDFATVNGLIGETAEPVAVDLGLEEGSTIEAGGYHFEVLHTPGHTSSCLCLFEPQQGLLLSGDTVLGGGRMGGIFGSGNISDSIHSLERLARLRVRTLLPGHGRISETGEADLAAARIRSRALLDETRELFNTLGGEAGFERILRAVRDLNRGTGRTGGDRSGADGAAPGTRGLRQVPAHDR